MATKASLERPGAVALPSLPSTHCHSPRLRMRARAATTDTLVGTTWGSYGGSSSSAIASEPPALTRFSAATPEGEHAAGWLARVHLDRQGRPEWRSGEELGGFVELERVRDDALAISSVIVRAYWQSTTVYTAHRLVQVYPDQTGSFLAKLKPASSIQAIAETKAEWHRSHLDDGGEGIEIWSGGELAEIRREVEGDFPLLGGLGRQGVEELPPPPPEPITDGRSTLPFAFILPTSSRVTSSSVTLHPPPDRRDLQIFARTPPPSVPGSAGLSGVVEWVVEVLVRFQDTAAASDPILPSIADSSSTDVPPNSLDELPSFLSATDSSTDSISSFGFLSPSPHLLVHRVVFPFEPLDLHTQDLYSSWRPNTLGPWSHAVASRQGIPIDEVQDDRPVTEGWVPQFGRDPRDEALGGSNMGTRRAHRGVLVEQEGGREHWSSFEKRMAIKSTRLGRIVGWVRAETSLPYPAIFPRHASHLPILLHLSFTPPDTTSSATPLSPAAASTPPRSVAIDKAVLILSRRTLARGGRETRPQFGLVEMRRVEVKLWAGEDTGDELTQMSSLAPMDSRASAKVGEVEDGRAHLRLVCGEKGVDLKLEFPMQTEGMSQSGKRLIPARELLLSCRTPNLEVEYILSITIHPTSGHPSFYAARVPLQMLAGESDSPAYSATAEGSEPVSHVVAEEGLPAYE